jgi:hypothetical protein
MSPVIPGDFSKISANSEPLTAGTYRFRLDRIIDQENDPEWKAANAVNNKQPAVIFISEVSEGDRAGTEVQDYQYFKTKEGKPNKRALSRLKAYAEAIQGQEAANSPQGINTDTLPGGEFIGIMEVESYMDNKVSPPVQKSSVKLAKILPVT